MYSTDFPFQAEQSSILGRERLGSHAIKPCHPLTYAAITKVEVAARIIEHRVAQAIPTVYIALRI